MHTAGRKLLLRCDESSRRPGHAALVAWREPSEGLRSRVLVSGILTLPLAGQGFHVELPVRGSHR
jgi:hypothetical protein